MEIQAEIAAAARLQNERPSHGFLRFLTWCMPTFVFYLVIFGMGYLSYFIGVLQPYSQAFALALCVAINFGIGCFDGLLARQNIVASSELRKKRIVMHGIQFAAHQIWLIPAISVIVIGILFIIYD